MDTSEKSTASQLMIMGFDALDYVRTCSADPGRLAAIFASDASYDEANNSITIPPLHVAERWDALDGARLGLMSDLRQASAAERYRPQA